MALGQEGILAKETHSASLDTAVDDPCCRLTVHTPRPISQLKQVSKVF